MNFTFRKAESSDAQVCEHIAQQAYCQYIEIMEQKPAPMLANYVAHIAKDDVFVLEDNSCRKIAAFVVIVVKTGVFWLDNIAVADGYRGRGLGNFLIEKVEKFITDKASSYRLYTNAKMHQNIDWYRRLGFKEYYSGLVDGYDRIYFEKYL